MSQYHEIIGYEPADLTVHLPPPQNYRGWVHFFRFPKNVLKGKPVLFGVIQVKRPKNVVVEHIHSNQIFINLTLFDNNE